MHERAAFKARHRAMRDPALATRKAAATHGLDHVKGRIGLAADVAVRNPAVR